MVKESFTSCVCFSLISEEIQHRMCREWTRNKKHIEPRSDIKEMRFLNSAICKNVITRSGEKKKDERKLCVRAWKGWDDGWKGRRCSAVCELRNHPDSHFSENFNYGRMEETLALFSHFAWLSFLTRMKKCFHFGSSTTHARTGKLKFFSFFLASPLTPHSCHPPELSHV